MIAKSQAHYSDYIKTLLQTCVESGASDVHLTADSPPILRRFTDLIRIEAEALTAEDVETIMTTITPKRIVEEYNATGSGDFSYEFDEGIRFRVAVFKQKLRCAMAMRKIPNKIIPLANIGLPSAVKEICQRANGLFLVTGPTGSGKTTTLASIIDHMNGNYRKHIITLEDPIEYHYQHNQCLIHQREIGVDVPTFQEGLRRVLREDPDVILVGEMRDLETISAAVTAAETGHLVFATLHTLGATATVNRIIDVFPASEQEHIRVQIAGSLRGIVSQALCPLLDGSGVVAAYEFLFVTEAIRSQIRNDRPFSIDTDILIGKKYGMQLLDDHLHQLAHDKVISPETAIEKSRDPRAMGDRVRPLMSGK